MATSTPLLRRTRYARSGAVRENEILRISAVIGGADDATAAEDARREILAWAQNRCGGRLPHEAWTLQSFDYYSGGRNSSGVRLTTDNADVWALRAEDPDRTVPGRVWTTEVVVALASGIRPRLSVRLIAHTAEEELFIEPHTPGFVIQLADRCGLHEGGEEFRPTPRIVDSEEESNEFYELLTRQDRLVPIFAIAIDDAADGQAAHLLNAESLARATLGIGHVAVLSPAASWRLTARLGQHMSVHSGAARTYLPGFSEVSNPYDHRIVFGRSLATREQAARIERSMRLLAAQESVRRNRLGQEILTFASVRLANLSHIQESLNSTGASDDELLQAAYARISALENDLDKERSAQEFFALEADKAEERAQAAEAQHRASSSYIQHLQREMANRGELAEEMLPATWTDFSAWCDSSLAGRVVLAPAARRSARDPTFVDVSLAVRCVLWLSTIYRDGRINGAAGDFVDYPLENGIRNSACGGDEFDFLWEGRRYTADWHVKNGGNTRDPRVCLRIYYCWDEDSQQVVIADMPAHRSTGAT